MTETTKRKFISLIRQELENDSLVLPTLSNVAIEIRSAINNQPDISVQDIVAIVSKDPALSGRLIQVANGSLYSRRGRQQKSIEGAIIALGNVNTVQLVTAFAIKQSFTPSSPFVAQYFSDILQHTLSVSAISRGMASFAPTINAEEAMLAGLVYQIGKLPVLKLYENSKTNLSEEELNKVLTKTHPYIGKIILQKWGFPDDLVKVPAEYLDFKKTGSNDVSYADIVTVAYLQECACSFGPHSNIDWSTVPAFGKLGLTPDFDGRTDDVIQEIEAALTALS